MSLVSALQPLLTLDRAIVGGVGVRTNFLHKQPPSKSAATRRTFVLPHAMATTYAVYR